MILHTLHVFIFCVAYDVPVTVFKFTSKGIGGDNIKFDDFCLGVGMEPIAIQEVGVLDEVSLIDLATKSQ